MLLQVGTPMRSITHLDPLNLWVDHPQTAPNTAEASLATFGHMYPEDVQISKLVLIARRTTQHVTRLVRADSREQVLAMSHIKMLEPPPVVRAHPVASVCPLCFFLIVV